MTQNNIHFKHLSTHSFIFTRSVIQLNTKNRKAETKYRISLPNNFIVECLISYKLVPITVGGLVFPKDLIQFDLLDFDIILEMNRVT